MQKASYPSLSLSSSSFSNSSAPPASGALRNDINGTIKLNDCSMEQNLRSQLDRVDKRGENLEMLVQQSQALTNASYDFYASAKRKKSGGFFDGITGFFKNLIEKKPEPMEEKKMS